MTLRTQLLLPALALAWTLTPQWSRSQTFEVMAQFPQTVIRPSGGLVAGPNPDNSNLRLYGLSEYGGTGGAGVLYSYEPATNTFAIEADFGKDFGNLVSPTDLSARVGVGEHRIVAIGGSIYGATADGGTQGYGILWKWTPTTVPPPPSPGPELIKIAEFNGTSTGGHPRYGVVTDATGTKLYGTCSVGGDNSAGTLWEATLTTGSPTVLHHFSQPTAVSVTGASTGGVTWSDNRLYGLSERTNISGVREYLIYTYELTGIGGVDARHVFSTDTQGFPRGTLTANTSGNVSGVTYASATSAATARLFRYNVNSGTPRVSTGTISGAGGISLTVQQNTLYGIARTGSGTNQGKGWLFTWSGSTASDPINTMATFTATQSDAPTGLLFRDSSDGKIYGTSIQGGTSDEGTLWRFTPIINTATSAGTAATLHSCTPPTAGGYPGGVIAHPNGSIFGYEQVSNSVWRWSPASPLERMASLSTAAQGMGMFGQMTVNAAGDVFGLTSRGGGNGNGTLYQWNQHGGVTTRGSFGSASVGGLSSGGTVMDANGNVYGITNQLNGLSAPTTRLWRLTAAGAFATLATFNTLNHGAFSIGNLAVDASGAVYGICISGGANNRGTLWKWVPGTGLTRLGSFPSGNSHPRRPYGGVAVKADGSEVFGYSEPGNSSEAARLWKWTSADGFANIATFTRAAHGEPFTYDSQVSDGTVTIITAAMPLVISTSGTLFGVTDRNGPSSLGCGVLWSFATGAMSPTINVARVFRRSENDGGRGIMALTFGSDGRLYGATDNALWRFGSPPAAQAPSVVTKDSTLQTATRLTVNGVVNAHGATTNVSFEYGTSPTNLNQTVTATPATATGSGVTNVSATLKFLTPATTYYYRVVGQSANGTSRGGIAKATTAASSGPPIVTTGAASGVDHVSATLEGTVNPNHMSNSVDIVIQWGLAANALTNTTVAAPATATGTTVVNVSAALTGLSPHTKYFYRVVAAGDHGLGLGTVQNFSTINRIPTGSDDAFFALPGAPMTMNVLGNDSDPDMDALSVKSFTQPAAGVGRVARSGSNLVFTPGTGFASLAGPATFTYVLQDSLGATASAPVTVTITRDTISITPPTNTGLLAAATSYTVSVDTGAASTPWRAVKTAPYVTLSASSGNGDAMIQVNVAANTTKNPRTTTIVIGGETHVLTQAGVVAPVVSTPGMIPPAVVSGSFNLPFHTYLPPATYTANRLPPGVKVVVNPATGEASLQGIPDRAGDYNVTIKATNAASTPGNAAASTISFTIPVRPLPAHMIGNHVAKVPSGNSAFNAGRGALIQFDVTSTGAVSGNIRLGAATTAPETLPFKSRLIVTPVYDPNPIPPATLPITVPRKSPLAPLVINVTLQTAASTGENLISGDVGVQGDMASTTSFNGWRNKWTLAAPATVQVNSANQPVREIFNTYFEPTAGETSLPEDYPLGDGVITFTLEPAGVVTWVAAMPDGVTATGKFPLSPTNDLFVWMPLYKKAALDYIGRADGTMTITRPADTVTGTISWQKDLQITGPGVAPIYNYLGGFTTTRTVVGGRHQVPTATFFQLPDLAGNAQLNFLYGGIAAANQAAQINQNFKITTANTAVFSAPSNPAAVRVTLNKTLGTFNGTFSLTDGAIKRSNIAFRGVFIDAHLPTGFGRGFFVLPQKPASGTSTATTPRLSGRVELLPD